MFVFEFLDKQKYWASILFLGLMNPLPAHALINGKPIEKYPDLVRLVFLDGTMCTGAYLNDTSILTAAHCLMKAGDEPFHKLEKILSVEDRPLPVQHLQNILHPQFTHSWWPAFDVGVIKTTKNPMYRGDFKIAKNATPLIGRANLFGCGIVEFIPKARARSIGANGYFRIGSVLLFLGESRDNPGRVGERTSIAPNDSGGPIVDSGTGEIIGISTQATAAESNDHNLPALSIGTSIMPIETLQFIESTL